MRERVSLAGGTLSLASSERGTVVRAWLPTGRASDATIPLEREQVAP
jgi:signal transduction histidine kinase